MKAVRLTFKKPGASIQSFMEAFRADTYENPFNPHERVWRSKVRLCLDFHEDYIWLSSVESLEPRKGHGSECMDWLLDLVIEHGVTIKGNIQGFGPKRPPTEKLCQWYRECGFTVFAKELYFNGEDE